MMMTPRLRALLPSLALALLALAGAGLPVAAAAEPGTQIRGHIVAVSDGDSLTAQLADGSRLTLRLWGVDAPETGAGYGVRGQPFAATARSALRRLVLRQDCTFTIVSRDQRGRAVARVFDSSGQDAGLSLLTAGLAWHDARFAPHATAYRDATAAARCERRGLFAARVAPVPPWTWRAEMRQRQQQRRQRSPRE